MAKSSYFTKRLNRGGLFAVLAACFISAFLLFSCSNLIDDDTFSTSYLSSAETVSITGKIITNGAVPSQCANINCTQITGRAAIPSNSGYKYFLEDNGTELEELPITDGSYSYNLVLNKSYKLKVVMKADSGTPPILYSEEWEITPSRANLSALQHDFLLRPMENGTGSVNLNIKIESDLIYKVKTSCSDSNWSATEWINTDKSSDVVYPLTKSSVESGIYEVSMNFYDEDGFLLYSTTQSITVFPTLETDTWKTEGISSIITNPSTTYPKGLFKIDENIINSFTRTQIYVGNTGAKLADGSPVSPSDDAGTGSPYAPFKTLQKAADFLSSFGKSTENYTIWICGTVTGCSNITVENAKSIKICGHSEKGSEGYTDILDGEEKGNVLIITMAETIPVYIKNLKITKGITKNIGLNRAGAGIALKEGTLYLENVEISDNHSATHGGGINTNTDTTLYIKSGVNITGNTAVQNGGGINNNGTIYFMDGAFIRDNEATGYGGAIYNEGTFNLSGSAIIPYGDAKKNDVCLVSGKFITIDGPLTGTAPVAAITMSPWARGVSIIKADGTKVTDLTSYKDKFEFTEEGWETILSSDKQSICINKPIYVADQNSTPPGNDSNNGSKKSPYATLAKACKDMNNSAIDYIIKIDGEVTGAQEIPADLTKTTSGTYKAKSVTICGASGLDSSSNPQDSLHLTTAGKVLSISTDVPVTIKDLKIEGADNYSIATTGLSLTSGKSTDVTISDGVVITGNYDSGVNIGASGKLTMTGGQIIENHAEKGAGVMNAGTFIMNGGRIDGNTTSGDGTGEGGGVYSTNKITMTSGKIVNNSAEIGSKLNGGGVYFSGTFEFSGGTINGNFAKNLGGGLYADGGTLFMSGSAVIGSITLPDDTFPTASTPLINRAYKKGGGIYTTGEAKVYIGYTDVSRVDSDFSGGIGYNFAKEDGGGIFIEYNEHAEVLISGGKVSNNAIDETGNGHGGAIYAGGKLFLLRKAYIPGGEDNKNDIYLNADNYIYVNEALTASSTTIATITPSTYSESKQVLNGTEALIAASCAKFALSDNDWIIGKDGKCYSTIVKSSDIGFSLPAVFKQISTDSTKPIKLNLESNFFLPSPNYFEVTYPLVIEGNHKISSSYDKALFTVKEGGKLTIKEGVEVEYTGSGKAAISIENGEVNIEGTASSPVKISASAYNPSGILINGGTLKAKNLTISASNTPSLTIEGGSVTIENMTANNTTKSKNGGGIYISGGTSTLTNCEISGNKLSARGGSNYMGGGIFMVSGTLTLNKCTIQNNIAAYYGGVGNGPTHGGGIFAGNGSRITISSNTTISGNGVSEGGEIEGKQYYFEAGVIYNGRTLSSPEYKD